MIVTEVNEAASKLAELMDGKRTLAITGAGVSTDSGLPDYRGLGTTEEPSIEFDMFVSDPIWQRWVWQRNHETWKILDQMRPSPAHLALKDLEDSGHVLGMATQNVDGLHTVAGSRNVWEMHGSFRTVDCVNCGARISRSDYAVALDELNPNWPTYNHDISILAPARRAEAEASTFSVAPCDDCGGIMKPSVVFFGEMLSKAFEEAMEAAAEAEVAVVVGSSLMVTTGIWVTRQAWAKGCPLAIVNLGPTSEDGNADLRIEAGASEVLGETARLLLS